MGLAFVLRGARFESHRQMLAQIVEVPGHKATLTARPPMRVMVVFMIPIAVLSTRMLTHPEHAN